MSITSFRLAREAQELNKEQGTGLSSEKEVERVEVVEKEAVPAAASTVKAKPKATVQK